jgi:hypothetical protein
LAGSVFSLNVQNKDCRDCGDVKPLSAFQWRKETGKYRNICNTCRHFTNTKRLYGIDRKAFYALREAQGYKCAICKVGEEDAKYAHQILTPLVVDHDHETGVVRGLLCMGCNFMLGKAKDNTDTLQSAIEYLKVTRK